MKSTLKKGSTVTIITSAFKILIVCLLFSQLPVAAASGQTVTPAATGGLVAAAATPTAGTGTATAGVTQLPQLTIVQNQHGQQMLSVSLIRHSSEKITLVEKEGWPFWKKFIWAKATNGLIGRSGSDCWLNCGHN